MKTTSSSVFSECQLFSWHHCLSSDLQELRVWHQLCFYSSQTPCFSLTLSLLVELFLLYALTLHIVFSRYQAKKLACCAFSLYAINKMFSLFSIRLQVLLPWAPTEAQF